MITGTADILSNYVPVVIDTAFGNFLYRLHTVITFDMQEGLYKHEKQLIFSYHTNEQHINLKLHFYCPSVQIYDVDTLKNHLIETTNNIVLNENHEINLLSSNPI